MTDALAITQASMDNDELRMRVVSNNLANMNTIGYKREVISNESFADVLNLHAGATPSADNAVRVPLPALSVSTDRSEGGLRYTGNPLDLAFENNAWLEVSTDQGPAYTQRGDLRLDSSGQLVTASGAVVNGTGGELNLTTSKPVINSQGEIFENGHKAGQLSLVSFANSAALQSMGDGLYRATGNAVPVPVGNVSVRQGYTELPNVVVSDETIHMLETVRHFESSQKVIQGYSQMLDTSIRLLGEF